jgi:chromate transporter
MNAYKLFKIFFRVGAFTIGGGYAMVPIIEEEIVNKNNLLTEEEFLDILAMAQSLPGPIAVNMSTFVGYRIMKSKGAALCAIGTVLPSFLSILVIAKFLYSYYDNPYIEKFFMGIRPAVAGLIFSAAFKLRKGLKKNVFTYLIVILSLIVIILFKINPVFMIIFSALAGIFIYPRLYDETSN